MTNRLGNEPACDHQRVSRLSARAEEMVDRANCGLPAVAGRAVDFRQRLGAGAVHLQPLLSMACSKGSRNVVRNRNNMECLRSGHYDATKDGAKPASANASAVARITASMLVLET